MRESVVLIPPIGSGTDPVCLVIARYAAPTMKTLCIAVFVVFAFAACERKGPAEKAGEAIDRAGEKASRSIEKAGENVRDAVKRDK